MTVDIIFTIADPHLDDCLATEAASILRGVIERIEEGETFATLLDSRGNEVGALRVRP